MGQFTHYLTVREEGVGDFEVRINPHSPLPAIRDAFEHSSDLRYSPILPAYLTPGEQPREPPATPTSIAFFFAQRPYYSLGKVKPALSQEERELVFFTEGLASIVMIDFDHDRALDLKAEIGCSAMEFWALRDGMLTYEGIQFTRDPTGELDAMPFDLTSTDDSTLDVYVEQISASITTLWAFYGQHFPEERDTLLRILKLTKELVQKHAQLTAVDPDIIKLREKNAIISALVELSASLSYSVTQGTSGTSPLLSNRSPFPHHSLIGIGGAIRALTNYTRYLECAFLTRSAAEVIKRQYSSKPVPVPSGIATYESGAAYSLRSPKGTGEEFDSGGDFALVNNVPLLTHFSLRHGFKETKFSLTAASESLTAECLPAWTLMTLSHEVMHSRVRDIFQELFGATWEDDSPDERWETFYNEFKLWYKAPEGAPIPPLKQGIRNAVLNYCFASERASDIVPSRRDKSELNLSITDVRSYFRKHQRLATELFVHFHDYYFAYACQPKLYVMSLWASWTTVAAPVARPDEYLIRTLATIACGTGLETRAAFAYGIEALEEGLDSLESVGIRSALFAELRRILSSERERILLLFKPAYYLIDQVRLYFASPLIVSKIDRLETDPFAEGSEIASEYSSSIYVHGEQDPGKLISPIRYSLAALVRELSGEPPIGDLQWLSAWNTLVISSQEVGKC